MLNIGKAACLALTLAFLFSDARAQDFRDVPLLSVQSNYGLDVAQASPRNGARIIQWLYRRQLNQRFDIRHGPLNTVSIRPKHVRNKCLDVEGASRRNGAAIIMFDCGATPRSNQLFIMTAYPGGSWLFRNKLSQKCLDIRDASMNEGAQLIQWDCHFGANQRFTFE